MRHSRASLMARVTDSEATANEMLEIAFCEDLIGEIGTLPVALRDRTIEHVEMMNRKVGATNLPRSKSPEAGHAMLLQWTAGIAPEVAETVGRRWNLEWKLPQGEESASASPDIAGPVAGGVAMATSAKTNVQD